MRRERPGAILEPLRTLFGPGTAAGSTDGQLLERFAAHRNVDAGAQAAFAALVARHGPMVRRVCRSLLPDPHDADDVFQATFLVLARKAGMIRRPELLGNWLYGTAHRTAQKLKIRTARRLKHEAREASMAGARVSTDADDLERQAVRREEDQLVHEEVARLPEVYRAAVVLCDLEGQSHEEAARRFRCSDRTLRRRLGRARDLLRTRLTRRGLAPTATAGLLAAALGPEPASAAIPQITVDALARAATRFAARHAACSTVSILADAVTRAMFRAKLKGAAMASGIVLAIGMGAAIGIGLRFTGQEVEKPAASRSGPSEVLRPKLPTPAEQYRALLRDYDHAMEAYTRLGEKAKTTAETEAAYQGHHIPEEDFNPRFLKLAERYPNDPAAKGALEWIVDKTTRYGPGGDGPVAETIGRAMEILARDHVGEESLGPLCLKLVNYPSAARDVFLRTVADRSTNRVTRGHAILALAQYLKTKGEFVQDLKKPGVDPDQRFLLAMYGLEYLRQLRAVDPRPMLRESDQLLARVMNDYGEIAFISPFGQPTRETLADVAGRERRPGPAVNPDEQFRALDDSFRFAAKAADRAAVEAQKKAGKPEPGEANARAYIAGYPKWGDYGPKMWRLAQDSPRHNAAFDALIWLVAEGPRFFDDRTQRDGLISRAVDALIRDHLKTIAEHLTDRNVAIALNMGEQLPMPYRQRLLRALHEHGRDRETRGRMGLALGRYLKAEADYVERLIRPGAEMLSRLELILLEPAFVDQLRKADSQAIARRAEDVLERVIADYGDVRSVNGQLATTETLADVARRELAEIRTMSVGKMAPEIAGEDVDGKPMKLSAFRGKVILLDFGSHEHCAGCVLCYPRLRSTVDRLRGRPFVVLGINNHDRRQALKQAIAKGEITWRCWWDGDKLDSPGAITTRWNVRGYPTFLLIDHRGVIRSRAELHPFDTAAFDIAIEALLKEAEAAGLQRSLSRGDPN